MVYICRILCVYVCNREEEERESFGVFLGYLVGECV